ncbi:MAG: hypothetical protein GY705_03365, partial [Bacteroidetes bacterium]|nr:hypothetical protein [Bacteroidota bacterium]
MVWLFLIHFSTFQYHVTHLEEAYHRKRQSHRHLPRLATTNLVSQTSKINIRQSHHPSMELSGNAPEKDSNSSIEQKIASEGISAVRQQYSAQGLTDDVVNFLVLAWRSGTIKNYDCQLKKWLYYCTNLDLDPFHPTVGNVLSYLKSLFDIGLSYSAIGTARSALSHIIKFDGAPVGQHPLVKLFMKSVFQQRPALS